jgi:hypothetical protein
MGDPIVFFPRADVELIRERLKKAEAMARE